MEGPGGFKVKNSCGLGRYCGVEKLSFSVEELNVDSEE